MNSAIILVLFAALLNHTVFVRGQLPNIYEIINNDDRLETLAKAIKLAELDEATQQSGSFTVFAPSNAAFSKVPQENVDRLSNPENKDELAQLLSYHAIGDKALTSTELSEMNLPTNLQALTGDFIIVSKQDNELKINDASIIESDISASNGIIHIIDTVLTIPKSSDK